MSAASELRVMGLSIRVVALLTLMLQNATFALLLHQSRTRAPPYSAAAAVLLTELLKLGTSLLLAWRSYASTPTGAYSSLSSTEDGPAPNLVYSPAQIADQLRRDVFSSDSWKLAIPASLYVLQNNLMFVAGSNLDVGTYQVTYQLKILTTALFSVWILKRRLSREQWLSLGLLAVGVGIVEVSATQAKVGLPENGHVMNPLVGFLAVCAACTTSGLAGVYFELVLKSTNVTMSPQRQAADLWIRNIQLAFFSLLPAGLAVISPDLSSTAPRPSGGVFANFGVWSWSVVLIQVAGGLVTAVVIKYSDNVTKGFATSLAIVLASLAGALLFGTRLTILFMVGTAFVLCATYIYGRPAPAPMITHADNDVVLETVNVADTKPDSPRVRV